jgi:hypothetical protein
LATRNRRDSRRGPLAKNFDDHHPRIRRCGTYSHGAPEWAPTRRCPDPIDYAHIRQLAEQACSIKTDEFATDASSRRCADCLMSAGPPPVDDRLLMRQGAAFEVPIGPLQITATFRSVLSCTA